MEDEALCKLKGFKKQNIILHTDWYNDIHSLVQCMQVCSVKGVDM